MVISPLSLGNIVNAASGALAPATPAGGGFASTLGAAIQQVNTLQSTAEQNVTGLLAGSGQDIHTATMSVERASLAFDLLLQVRNKVVSAYQEVSRLQF